MKRKAGIVFVLLLASTIAVVFYFVSGALIPQYTKVIRNHWDLRLPDYGAEDTFSYSEPSFHGDGSRCHVIEYSINSSSKKMQNSLRQLDEIFSETTAPTALQLSTIEQILDEIDADLPLFPDWESCQFIYRHQDDESQLFLFYAKETGTVYVIESFI